MDIATEGQRAIDLIVDSIKTAYAHDEDVLLLLPGGSAARLIGPLFGKLVGCQERLTISLTDERYVDVASADSNWHAVAAHQERLPNATFVPVLTGDSRDQANARFKNLFQRFANNPQARIVMLLGMGADGHTSGIKPHSLAAESSDAVCDYAGLDYERITTTGAAFVFVDLAVIYAEGVSKAAVVADFARDDISPLVMPAQFVKQAKSYELVYQP